MSVFQDYITPDTHGYLIEGTWDTAGGALEKAVIAGLAVQLQANPDVVRVTASMLGIDDARFIATFQSRKSIGEEGGKKIVFVVCQSMTGEAQNALLKIFEEPTPGTYFFVVAETAKMLLPTLRSRLLFLSEDVQEAGDTLVRQFLEASPSQRLTLVEKLVDSKDTMKAQQLLNDLLITLRAEMVEDDHTETKKHEYYALEEVLRAKRSLLARGASMKLLLEHVALIVPHYTV